MKQNVGNILVLQDLDVRTQNLMTEERLGRIQAPTLVVWTTDDPTSEIAEGHFWAQSIPNSRFELIEDAGHWPHYEQPERFNALHLEFLLSTLE
jgi:2-hydroxy-6-oxonona-2,4-dienedioate hydrolase